MPPVDDHLDAVRVRVSEHAHQQSAVLEGAAASLADVSGELAELAGAQQKMHDRLGGLNSQAEHGLEEAIELERDVGSLQGINQRLDEGVTSMDAVHEQIESINEIILEIRMLGLNTAIEAARAGEHGAGFQVVSSSMRELARSGARVAERIGQLVESTRRDLTTLTAETRNLLEARREDTERLRARLGEVQSGTSELATEARQQASWAEQRRAQAEQARSALQGAVEELSGETSELIGFITGVSIVDLEPAEVHGRLHTFVQQIDVRTLREWTDELGHIDSATHVPIAEADFAARLGCLRRDVPTLFICRSGGRSKRAARLAIELGFSEVYNLAGGMLAWRDADLPSVERQRAA